MKTAAAPVLSKSVVRCGIYIRVSTDEQVERARLREQQHRLPEFAQERGWSYTVVEDLGISGQTISGRPGMRRLLEMINADELDVVLVIEQSLWGALSRFRLWDERVGRRVVHPVPLIRGVVLVLVALLPGVALRVPDGLPACPFGALQGTRDRGAPA